MKIGIFDPYLDDVGGGEKYMMTLASCLAGNNEVDVFWDNSKIIEKISERFGLDLSKIKCVDNVFSKKYSFIKRVLITKQYDSIIFLSDGSIPVVGSKKLFIHLQQPLKKFQNVSIKDKIKLSRVTKFFSNSIYTKQFIGKKFDVKTVVLYPPVELFSQKKSRENIILHVGRFRVFDITTGVGDYKKQHVMIDSFKKMVDTGFKNWKFVLAVSVQDADRREFEEMQKKSRGYPIEFVVNQSNKILWEIYSRAKIYWHASGYGEDLNLHPEYAEHFGISSVEAMGAGCVPVVINAGGQREIVENGVNGILWDTLDELIEKTLEVIKDQTLWNRLSDSAKKRAEFFAGDRFCRGVKELIFGKIPR